MYRWLEKAYYLLYEDPFLCGDQICRPRGRYLTDQRLVTSNLKVRTEKKICRKRNKAKRDNGRKRVIRRLLCVL